MYPPATISSNAIKTQYHKGSKVFYPSSKFENRNQSRVYPSSSGVAANPKGFRPSNRPENVYRTRSNGSTGSSPGASTSPSVSTPLSRDSSVGSASKEDQIAGHIIARQGDLIARNSMPSMKPPMSSPYKSKEMLNNHTSGQSRSSKNSASKPFNHKEVVDFMNQAFADAKKAIAAGRGKYYDPKESGAPPVVFTPFNWEEFWQQRKMNELK